MNAETASWPAGFLHASLDHYIGLSFFEFSEAHCLDCNSHG